jgi:hypothetical protein
MARIVYKYRFQQEVLTEEIESSLLLAIWAAESLYGESQVRLDAAHKFDPERRACVIDAMTDVGCDLNRLFLGFIRREFDADAFTVERVVETVSRTPAAARD